MALLTFRGEIAGHSFSVINFSHTLLFHLTQSFCMLCDTIPIFSANNVTEPSTKFSPNENDNIPTVPDGNNDQDTPISNAGMEEQEEKADPSEQPAGDKPSGEEPSDDVASSALIDVEPEKYVTSPVNSKDLNTDISVKPV